MAEKKKFTESEYGDLLQGLIQAMSNDTRRGHDAPQGIINLIDASHVAIKFFQRHIFGPPTPLKPFVCPEGDPMHEEYPFTCGHLTPAQVEAISEMLAEREELGGGFCRWCGEPNMLGHRDKYHPNMWIGGNRVYGTVWHGEADL